MQGLLKNNPLIERYTFTLLRPGRFWISVGISAAVLLITILTNWLVLVMGQYSNVYEFSKGIFFQFLFLEIITLWVWGAFNSASAIRDEINDRSYDFFAMLPLTPAQKACGIMVGKNIVVLGIAAFIMLIVIISGQFTLMNTVLVAEIVAVLLSVAVLASAVALLGSMRQQVSKKNSNVAVLLAFSVFVMPLIFSGLGALQRHDNLQSVSVSFYMFRIPVLVLITALALYFAVWAITGILRKFQKERQPLMNWRGATLFLCGLELIVLGLFWQNLYTKTLYAFWSITAIPLFIIPLVTLRTWEDYFERAAQSKLSYSALIKHANPILEITLFVLWAAFALIATSIVGYNPIFAAGLLLAVFAQFVFIMLLVELYCFYLGNIKYLVVFMIGLMVVFPLILSGAIENKALLNFSPIGIFVYLSEYQFQMDTLVAVSIFYLGLSAILLLVLAKRFRILFDLRSAMPAPCANSSK